MAAWVFQGSMNNFDVNEYLRTHDYIYWRVVPKQVNPDILKIGDTVYIWRAKGSTNEIRGIIAVGTVVERAKPRSNVDHLEFLSSYDPPEGKLEFKVGIRLLEIRLTLDSGMLDYDHLMLDPVLSRISIIRRPQGTNYSLNFYEANRIQEHWNKHR